MNIRILFPRILFPKDPSFRKAMLTLPLAAGLAVILVVPSSAQHDGELSPLTVVGEARTAPLSWWALQLYLGKRGYRAAELYQYQPAVSEGARCLHA